MKTIIKHILVFPNKNIIPSNSLLLENTQKILAKTQIYTRLLYYRHSAESQELIYIQTCSFTLSPV